MGRLVCFSDLEIVVAMVFNNLKSAIDKFDFGFAENGLTAFKLGKQLASQSFINFLGEDRYKPLVNFILHYIADMEIPIKRYDTISSSPYPVSNALPFSLEARS